MITDIHGSTTLWDKFPEEVRGCLDSVADASWMAS